ncbi:MAG: hypothetical protein LBC73_10810 [Oscillospiraceae bacterium]|jgi:hypothetical protein|nr:hypothetical protein [Oscillospiraceae bacterium]
MVNQTNDEKLNENNIDEGWYLLRTQIIFCIFVLFSIFTMIVLIMQRIEPTENTNVINTLLPEFHSFVYSLQYRETFLYIVISILAVFVAFLIPVVPVFSDKTTSNKHSKLKRFLIMFEEEMIKISWVLAAIFIFVCFWIVDFIYLDATIIQSGANILITFIAFYFITLFYRYNKKIFNKAAFISLISISGFLIVCASTMPLLAHQDAYALNVHFCAYTAPIADVFYGRTLFTEGFANQYGFYPYLLVPIFKVIGLSVQNVSIVMCALILVINLVNLKILLLLIKNKILALLIFVNVIYFTQIYIYFDYYNTDYSYQHFPHRFLFPSIVSLLFIYFIRNFNKKKELLYFSLLFIACVLGLVWNLDAGIIVFLACLIGLVFNSVISYLANKRLHIVKPVAFLLGVPIVFIILIQTITYFRSELFVNIAEITTYQKTFVSMGFMMLPMPFLRPWILVAAIFVIGIVISMNYLHKTRTGLMNYDIKYVLLFYLSVVGVGGFTFYLGLTNDYTFVRILTFPYIVLALILDNSQELFGTSFSYVKNKKNGMFIVLAFLLFLQPFSLMFNYDKVARAIARNVPYTDVVDDNLVKITRPLINIVNRLTKRDIPQTRITDDSWVSSVKPFIDNDEELFVITTIAHYAYYVMLLEKRTANYAPSATELLLVKDFDRLQNQLLDNTELKIFMDIHSGFYARWFTSSLAKTLLFNRSYSIIWNDGNKFLLKPNIEQGTPAPVSRTPILEIKDIEIPASLSGIEAYSESLLIQPNMFYLAVIELSFELPEDGSAYLALFDSVNGNLWEEAFDAGIYNTEYLLFSGSNDLLNGNQYFKIVSHGLNEPIFITSLKIYELD